MFHAYRRWPGSPYFSKNDRHFQIDLLYKRSDKVITLCEIKYHSKPITTAIIPEIERKRSLLTLPKGYSLETALISIYGPDTSLRASEYFDYHVTLNDLFAIPNNS